MIIRRPNDSPPATAPGGRAISYDHAREAAKEKAKAKYLELICGHLTTWELDELYSAWRPAKYRFYCEVCDKFVARAPKRRVIYPPQDDVLF